MRIFRILIALLLSVSILGCAGVGMFGDARDYKDNLRDPDLKVSEHNAVYRFSWFRSFNEPYVIRVEKSDDGAEITVRTVRDEKLVVDNTHIDKNRWAEFLKNINQIGFWVSISPSLVEFQNEDIDCEARQLELCEMIVTADGASWVFEGAHNGNYHWLAGVSPQNGPLYELGVYMLSFAGVKYHGPLY